MLEKNSDHFDGKHYYNPYATFKSFLDVLKWMWNRKVTPWSVTSNPQFEIATKRNYADKCLVTFINHSTVLLQIKGLNILTDPIWSERASPFSWIGPKRVILPGVKFEELPPIDVVLLSHNHYDHMDLPTLKQLNDRDKPLFFVSKGNKKYLHAKGFKERVTELDWWDQIKLLPDVDLHFVPAQHFSARGIFDRNKTLWGGFVIKTDKQMIYFAGDTGFSPYFAEINKKLGSPTLSLLPIGAYEPRHFMQPVHLSPQEAVKAHLALQSKQSIAIHFGTFQLADEKIDAPILELKQALSHYQVPECDFCVLNPGETK